MDCDKGSPRVVEDAHGNQVFLGVAYSWDGRYFKSGKIRLHRAVYTHFHGPIPRGKGWHVHHIDEDRRNNQVENLELVAASEHLSRHNKVVSPDIQELRIRVLDENRHKASEWHRSAEGREWHRQHARKPKKRSRSSACRVCGVEFQHVLAKAEFCSKNCKAKARRDSGVDDVDRNCQCCGKSFRINRYRTTMVCSRSCSQSMRAGRCRA